MLIVMSKPDQNIGWKNYLLFKKLFSYHYYIHFFVNHCAIYSLFYSLFIPNRNTYQTCFRQARYHDPSQKLQSSFLYFFGFWLFFIR